MFIFMSVIDLEMSLFTQTVKLEEMEKKAGNAEGEVSALRSRLILLQVGHRDGHGDLDGNDDGDGDGDINGDCYRRTMRSRRIVSQKPLLSLLALASGLTERYVEEKNGAVF